MLRCFGHGKRMKERRLTSTEARRIDHQKTNKCVGKHWTKLSTLCIKAEPHLCGAMRCCDELWRHLMRIQSVNFLWLEPHFSHVLCPDALCVIG